MRTQKWTALVALLAVGATGAKPRPLPPARALNTAVTINIDAAANRHPIDPRIYGVAFVDFGQNNSTDLGATINRWGGNATSRHNWYVNTTNRAKDYFFENQPDAPASVGDPATPGAAADAFVAPTLAAGMDALITIPMMGMLPFQAQIQCGYTPLPGNDCCEFVDNAHNCGNGRSLTLTEPNSPQQLRLKGQNNTDYFQTFPPSHQAAWIQHLVTEHSGGVNYYALDNEPSLWSFDHWDVHPNGATGQEVWDDMATYGALIKATDPTALVTGVEEWGWDGYFWSGADQETYPDTPEYNVNGPYVRWLLKQAHTYEETNGTRILDFFALHFYPQGDLANHYEFSDDVTTDTQILRNRSTRALWDPSYIDQSYIGLNPDLEGGIVKLIPHMREWANNDYPGTKIGLTEYNWGAETHINGATAQADILGILGREGADMAVRWTAPPTGSLTYNAFKMYRNYDGLGAKFGDLSVSATSVIGAGADTDADHVSTFAALSSTGSSMTVMIIAKDIGTTYDVTVNLSNFLATSNAARYQLTSTNAISALTSVPPDGTQTHLTLTVPAQSITLLVIPGTYLATPGNVAALWAPVPPPDGCINVTWSTANEPPGATYQVWRNEGAGFGNAPLATTAAGASSYQDCSAGNQPYLYKVRAVNGALQSGFTTIDVATPWPTFTDDLTPSQGPPFPDPVVNIKAVHVNELRTAIDKLRQEAGLGGGTYTNVPIVAGTTAVTVENIREMRLAVDQARAWIGLPAVTYTHPALTAGTSAIKLQDINDLRDALK